MPAENGQRRWFPDEPVAPADCKSAHLNDSEHRMIPGVGQLRKARADKTPGNLAVSDDDGSPLVDWDLGGLEDLGLPLATQLACAGSSEIADPVRLTIRGHQIAALADCDPFVGGRFIVAPDRPQPGYLRLRGFDAIRAIIVWPARSRPAKLSRKQAQRHSTDERAGGADEQPVAPEPAAALVVGDGDSCFHRQD